MSIGGGAQLMQRLYEGGSISYPRSDNDALSDAALDDLARIAERHRINFDGGVAIPRFVASAQHPHEAIHLLADASARVDLTIPTRMLSPEDRVLQCLARSWLRQGVDIEMEIPETSHLPAWAQALPWSRPSADTPSVLLYDDEVQPSMKLTAYSKQGIALHLLADEGLGRPATIAVHADHLAERNAIGTEGLTPRGRNLLRAAPAALAQPETARRIEAILDGREDPALVRVPGEPSTSALPLVGNAIVAAMPTLMPDFERALAKSLRQLSTVPEPDVRASSSVSDGRAEHEEVPKRWPIAFRWPWAPVEAPADEVEQAVADLDEKRVAKLPEPVMADLVLDDTIPEGVEEDGPMTSESRRGRISLRF